MNLGRVPPTPQSGMNSANGFIQLAARDNLFQREQLVLQIADGTYCGLSVWWDAPDALQTAMREAVEAMEQRFEHVHTYWHGEEQRETRYAVDLEAMTCTNPDSGTVRALNIHARIMWQ